jgi:hypothetical protein
VGEGIRPRQTRKAKLQNSLFDEIVDLDAVRAQLGIEGYYRVAMKIREGLLRSSAMCRDMDLEVFDRHAERLIDARLREIGRSQGLFLVSLL